jgi:hypothetical protein
MERGEVLEIVLIERAAQSAWDSEGLQSVGEEILLLEYYVDKARAAWKAENPPETEALREIVKLAGRGNSLPRISRHNVGSRHASSKS